MLKLNSELKNSALETLEGKWGKVMGIVIIYMVIYIAIDFIPIVGAFFSFFIAIPLTYGLQMYFLKHFRGEEKNTSMLFAGFNDFGRVCGTLLLQYIFTALWSLLLIIPGIIKYYSYAMTPYILIDRPELKYNEAIELSMKIMDGKKMKLFLLHLSFIGWFLLTILTLGIGILWLLPYAQTSEAAFYQDLKDNMENEEEVATRREEV